MNGTMEPRRLPAAAPIPMRSWNDEELLLSYRTERDGEVFEELVHRYERELFAYLRHYLGNAEMAEDVFQQTFLQVHLKCEQFEPGRKVRPWLYTIATNQAIDYRRRNRRHRLSTLNPTAYPNAVEEAHGLSELLGSAKRVRPTTPSRPSRTSPCARPWTPWRRNREKWSRWCTFKD